MQSSTKMDKFLETICEQIRWRKAHNMISEEIKGHIIDQKDAFMEEGLDEEMAMDKAIKEMGDPVLIGGELDRTHRPRTEWSIIIFTGIMILFGFGIRLLASYEPDIPFMLGRSLVSTLIGIGCMTMAYFIDFTTIGKYPKSIFVGLTILIISMMLVSPIIKMPYTYVQSMLLLYPVIISGIIYNMRSKGYLGIVLSGLFLIIPILMGIKVLSLPSIVLCILTFLILITFAIAKDWFNVNKLKGILLVYVPAIGVASMIIIKWILNSNYRISRLIDTINPYKDPMGSGYITLKIRDMVSNAKLIGRGTMDINSYMIPDINTDYILTYLIHRLGWIAFIVVMAMISIFIIRSFILCSKQKSILGQLISTAVLITFTMEVIFYTINNLGFPLLSPLALPFISYGGMFTIVNMTLIGIMLSVFRSGHVVRDSLVTSKGAKSKFFKRIDGKIIIDLNAR